jgi:hypothetical protein
MIPALARRNGDHAMTKDTSKEVAVAAEALLFDHGLDGIEDRVRARVRCFIETMSEAEPSERRCQCNGGASRRVGRHARSQATLYAARARHSAGAAERLCLKTCPVTRWRS